MTSPEVFKVDLMLREPTKEKEICSVGTFECEGSCWILLETHVTLIDEQMKSSRRTEIHCVHQPTFWAFAIVGQSEDTKLLHLVILRASCLSESAYYLS